MKKNWSILIAGALIASVFAVAPANAAPEVPAEPLIVDPVGDANYVNDGQVVPIGKDHVTPADAGSVSDLMAVWMSDDADNIYAHFQTEAPGPATTALFYRLRVDPGVGATCLWLQGLAPGAGNPAADPAGSVRTIGDCGAETLSEGAEFIQEEGPDGTGIHTVKIPRALNAAFTDGNTLRTPWVDVTNFLGAATAPTIDNTEVGTDYVIGSGGTSEPPAAEPPGDDDPPGQGNQKCSKIKDKKKKKACKKNQKGGKGKGKGKKKPAGCAPYQPGEMGAEAETTIVTEEATEDAPIEIEVPLGPAGGSAGPYDTTTRAKHNVQVDVTGAEGGLFAKLESPESDDPDLYVYWDNGKEAAVAGGFNQALFAGPVPEAINGVINLNGTGKGGHSGFGYEQIDGLKTADCAGWTLDLVNWLGTGGDYTLSLWIGEIQNDPAPRE